jgi:hypothetical protein
MPRRHKLIHVEFPSKLSRLLGREFDGDAHESFTTKELESVRILSGKIYSVRTCQLFYTTYDVQRQSQSLELL